MIFLIVFFVQFAYIPYNPSDASNNQEIQKSSADTTYLLEPVFQVAPSNNDYGDDRESNSVKKKPTWQSLLRKIVSRSRKESFNRVTDSDEDADKIDGGDNDNVDRQSLTFIHKPFRTKTDDDSVSWWRLLKESLLRSISSSSSSSSKSSKTDRTMSSDYNTDDHLLLENVSDDSDNKISSSSEKKTQLELPSEPEEVDFQKTKLCAETFTGQALDVFQDGKAPTCIVTCLYYKIRHSKYFIRPEGRCSRFEMRRTNAEASETFDSCVCTDGFRKKYRRYRIIQRDDGELQYVYNPSFGLFIPLGTPKNIVQYVDANFKEYLKNYVKTKKGIDWEAMIAYVQQLRWLREPSDDRPVGTYLSDSLKEQITDVRTWWLSLREKMQRSGK